MLGNGGSVSLEEKVAECSCTAAGFAPPCTTTISTLDPPLLSCLPPLAALRLPSLGNCLLPLPACLVIGRWHGGVPLPDLASCTHYCLLMFQHTLPLSYERVHPRLLAPVARLHIQASFPPGNFIGQSWMAQSCCSGHFWEVRQYERIGVNNVNSLGQD